MFDANLHEDINLSSKLAQDLVLPFDDLIDLGDVDLGDDDGGLMESTLAVCGLDIFFDVLKLVDVDITNRKIEATFSERIGGCSSDSGCCSGDCSEVCGFEEGKG